LIERCCRQETRGATTKEHRVHFASPDGRLSLFQIRDQGLHILALRERAAECMRVEIAIRALPDAPWNMNVERKGWQRGESERPGLSQCETHRSGTLPWPRAEISCASFANSWDSARPRWLT